MESLRRQLAEIPVLDWVLRLTLLDVFLRPIGDWSIRPLVLILACAAVLVPARLRSVALWGALAGLAAWRVFLDWPLPDNHAYLLCYWCLAIAIALGSSVPERTLATTGRLLVGLVFGFATLWKLALSPDFLDGTFFRVTMLEDPRFEGFTTLVAGVGSESLEGARAALLQHVDGTIALQPVPELTPRFHMIARLATYWTGAIEACVALVFLLPLFGRLRDALLMIFCATTFAVADVPGFGWLLVVMGLAQSEPERPGVRAAYLAVFVLILLYAEVPWSRLWLG